MAKNQDVARNAKHGSKHYRAVGTSFRVKINHTPEGYSARHLHDGHVEVRPKDSLQVFPAVNGIVSVHHSAPGGDKSRHGYLGHFRVKQSTWEHMTKHLRHEDHANEGPANDNHGQESLKAHDGHDYIDAHLKAIHKHMHDAQKAYHAGKQSEGDSHMQKAFGHIGSAHYHNEAMKFGKNKGESA